MLKLQTLSRSSQYAGGVFSRYQSTISATQKVKDASFRSNVENFKDMTERRQTEALRSVILEVDSKDICGQVYNHCKQFGEMKNAFVYTLHNERTLMLIEYKHIDAVKETFKFSGFQSNTVHWPNRILTVRNSKLNASLSKDAPLQVDNAIAPKVAGILRNADTFDEQVDLLYEHTRLTDLSIRLKYLTALQAQTIINEFLDEIFPNAKVYPFGSTVNGFGKMGCDLDMALRYDDVSELPNENDHMPLAFQGTQFENAEDIKKLKEGRQVKCIAALLEYFVPRINGVSAFHGARVPIVRYFDENIHSSVDLSVNNLDGFQITDFMYTMGMLDRRVRPFIFMVRRWAKEFEVTRYNARDNFTNFQLSYMCLCFLQQLKQPIIPTVEDVMRQMDCTKSKAIANTPHKIFMFDCDRFHFETKNSDTVLELFKQFLDYYDAFDFSKYMITLRTIEKQLKPDPSPVYLENVFDSTQPWGGNVSDAETSTLKIMIRQTQQELEQCSTKPSDRNQDWGLLEIISKIK